MNINLQLVAKSTLQPVGLPKPSISLTMCHELKVDWLKWEVFGRQVNHKIPELEEKNMHFVENPTRILSGYTSLGEKEIGRHYFPFWRKKIELDK